MRADNWELSMDSKPITVIIPARNESGTITKVVHECLKSKLVKEVIVSDNVSKDDTAILAEAAGAHVVSCDTIGFGATLKCGIFHATTDWIFKIDADIINTNEKWISQFWVIAQHGNELVSGQWKHDPIYWALSYYVIRPHIDRILPGLSYIPLLNSGIYLVNAAALSFHDFGDGWGFDTMLHIEAYLSRLKIEICEIEPVVDYLRPHTQYLQTAADTIELFERVKRDPRLSALVES